MTSHATPPASASSRTRPLTIRPARWEELGDIAELIARANAQYRKDFPWPGLWDEYLADITAVAARWDRGVLLAAVRDGAVIGTVDYHPPYSGGYQATAEERDWVIPEHLARVDFPVGWAAVRRLATDPDHRRSGVARALTEELIGLAVQDRATHVFLHTSKVMTAAIAMYESMGFVRLPERDLAMRLGDEEPLLAYLLPLSAH